MEKEKDFRKIFAERLRELRGPRTVEMVAMETGIPQPTLTRYENNEREIGLTNLCILALYFGEDLNYLVGIND